jgi:CheY-like chemotaxis protein
LSILLVDDHPDAREVVSEILRRQRAKVAAAASAREAMMSLESLKPDLLLTDIGMPDENGFALLRKLRELPAEQGGAIPAIALTAFASADDRHQAIEAGFHAHLAKPVNPEELIDTVNRFGREAHPAAAH